jgi:hypothetical protein
LKESVVLEDLGASTVSALPDSELLEQVVDVLDEEVQAHLASHGIENP